MDLQLFFDEPSMVLGPDFIAKDIASYNKMVELEEHEAVLFWKRVYALKQQLLGDENS